MQAGETLTLTVNQTPVADVVPHRPHRSPWVPSSELRRIVAEAPADPGLFEDLAEVRSELLDDPR